MTFSQSQRRSAALVRAALHLAQITVLSTLHTTPTLQLPINLLDIVLDLGPVLLLDEVAATGGNLDERSVERGRTENVDMVSSERATAEVEHLGRVLVLLRDDLDACGVPTSLAPPALCAHRA